MLAAAPAVADRLDASPALPVLRTAIIVASAGRADLLADMAQHWLSQSRAPDRIVVSVPDLSDAAGLPAHRGIEIVTGRRGLCAQRNRALDHLAGACDLAIFLDDDFVPSTRFLAEAVALFCHHPDVVAASGTPLADGINTAGIPLAEAARRVAEADRRPVQPLATVRPNPHAYGCNLVLRMAAAPDLRFDERLPLYGWQEDLDMSRRLGRHGAIVASDALVGVHMGVKAARTSGRRLGYSQVANPAYLTRKGVLSAGEALRMAGGNLLMNLARSLAPEPWVDRRGRLAGNLLALRDAVLGRLAPERILDL